MFSKKMLSTSQRTKLWCLVVIAVVGWSAHVLAEGDNTPPEVTGDDAFPGEQELQAIGPDVSPDPELIRKAQQKLVEERSQRASNHTSSVRKRVLLYGAVEPCASRDQNPVGQKRDRVIEIATPKKTSGIGMIEPNDWVDVLAFVSGGEHGLHSTVKTIASNAKVIAIREQNQNAVVRVQLEVTQRQAELLTLSSRVGELVFVKRTVVERNIVKRIAAEKQGQCDEHVRSAGVSVADLRPHLTNQYSRRTEYSSDGAPRDASPYRGPRDNHYR